MIPDSVTSIGKEAFRYCDNLKSVKIPNSECTTKNPFKDCPGLADSDGFVIVNGMLCDYNGPGGDVVIPEGVTAIGDEVFYEHKKLTSVNLPDSVEWIGDRAFQFCKQLTEVTIPENLKSIGKRAFFGCRNLERIKIPGSVERIATCCQIGTSPSLKLLTATTFNPLMPAAAT